MRSLLSLSLNLATQNLHNLFEARQSYQFDRYGAGLN